MTSTFINRIFPLNITSNPLSIWTVLMFLAVYTSIVCLTLLNGMDIVLWALLAGVTAIGIYCVSPRLWIYSVLLSSYFFYSKGGAGGEETSSQPIIFALVYHLSLAIWIFSHILLKRKKLIHSWIDLLFFVYLLFAALNCFLALSNGVEFLIWLKGWQLYLVILYYLPIRELFDNKKSQQTLLFVCTIVLLTQGIWNIYQYKLALSNFKWATQLFYAGIRQGAAVFSVASVASLAAFFYSRKPLWRILLLGFHIFCFIVLIVSLARAAWVGYAVGVVLMCIFARGKYLRSIILSASTTIAIVSVVSILFLGKYTDIAWNVASARFSSSAGFATDPSYLSRIYENESLLKGIKEYPIGGGGLQKEHNRYDAISRSTVINTYAHNNYLGMMQKLGIPLALLYFLTIGGVAYRSLRIARQLEDPFYIFLATSSYAALSAMAIINFVGSIFDLREGMFLLAILFAFSFIAEKALKNQQSHEHNC
jgi:hypothetical protein